MNIRSFIIKHKVLLLLALIIIAQLCRTTYVFAFQKNSVHSDEIWSYGLANSYYKPFIYSRDGVFVEDYYASDQYYLDKTNVDEWSTGETYNNYITVQPGEQFSYGSVYHNQTLDHHPPLYYFLLHTVCSFFPDTFSFWFAYFLNCIFLVFTQIFLFKLIKTMSGSDQAAICGCLLYGAGIGALSTFIFLRQYSMLTMLAVIYTYFNARLYDSDDLDLKKNLPPIAVFAFLAFMTHYYGIAYVGIFTACMCIYMAVRKKIKKMFIYGLTITGALGLFLLIYPAALKQFGYSIYESKIMPFRAQTLKLASYVTRYNIGIKISMYEWATKNIILAVLFSAAVISVPLCFLFRKESWFIRFVEHLKTLPKKLLDFLKTANYIWLFLIVDIIVMVIFVSYLTDFYLMREYVMRYLFVLFPFICTAAVILVYRIFSMIPRIKRYSVYLTLAAVIITIVRVNLDAPNVFVYTNDGDYQDPSQLLEGKNCVVILNSDWMLTCLTHHLRTADNVYATTPYTFEEDMDEILSKEVHIDYVIVSRTFYSPDDEEIDMISSWNIFNDDVDYNITIIGEFPETSADYICNDLISQLNGGTEHQILFGLNAVNDYFYVMELE